MRGFESETLSFVILCDFSFFFIFFFVCGNIFAKIKIKLQRLFFELVNLSTKNKKTCELDFS